MSTFFQLDEERLRGLEEKLASSMPLPMLERGWDYYRREKVLSVQVMDGTAIYGTVRETEIYAVTLDTDDFSFSTCTCAYNGYCKHMAAVFYSYCAYAGESPDEVHNRLLYGGELVQIDRVSMENAPSKLRSGTQDEVSISSAGWLDEMERLHGEAWRQCRHSLHPLQAVLSALKGLSKAWDEGLRRLHWMHAILFVIDQAERAYSSTDSYSRYYYEMAFARMTEPWVNHYHELAAELESDKMSKTEKEAVEGLVTIFHERDMDREQQLHRWETLYFSLWGKLISHKEWREKEEEWLNHKLKSANQKGHPHFFYPMALAYLAFAEDRDEQAIALLRKTAFNRTALLASDCAMQRLEERDFMKLEGWITYLYEGLTIERKSRAFGPFLSMCRVADVQQPDNPAWQQYLISFLPFSYSALTEHWLERRKYEHWADLQLLLGIEPDEMDIQVVREIAKDAPQVLYPLYHQAIEGSIRMRNRQGYKQAVKLMKKLERLYKAEKQQDKWSRYVDGVVRKHQRLRALQEELWRGKIIT
ncbi:hypothetical protein Back11_00730 [Paenibacillus baekrokdamisoli]|uniref:Uncharacterized protein n=1 Tax=Paenibacillus baekrokdamisoli TaxID=1712516 RepID=A0A3G9J4X8_9BACL|nr:SWIM zinc finger family protein [Paenibacillus baekrokdamisoli]MBB3069299.1 hypothetical protein [Paenibacillus baekrokdamisoli]BBH18728.1 hypothetical protein Back11_00730 [Paenibacillus baekrokdamisoli]